MLTYTEKNAHRPAPMEVKTPHQCCFDYTLGFHSIGRRNRRNILLSILIYEETVELGKYSRILRLGVRRCELTTAIINGELSLNTRRITNPLPLSKEVSYTKTSRREKEQKSKHGLKGDLKAAIGSKGASAGANLYQERGKKDQHDTTQSYTITEFAVESGGSPSTPTWVFRNKDGDILKFGIQDLELGEIKKTGSPCRIEANCRTDVQDVVISDASGILARSASKFALVKFLLMKQLGLQPLSLQREFEIA